MGNAERIEQPRDLELPPEMVEVLAMLTPEGREMFVQEIVEAVLKSQASNNLAPLQNALLAWTRSRLFAIKTADRDDVDVRIEMMLEEDPITDEEIQALLNA